MQTPLRRILIADENPGLRSALALLLETRLGAQIVGGVDTMDALISQTATTQPDLVILECELPGQPVDQRLAALRQVAPSVKVVVTSIRPEAVPEVCKGQADGFIDKTAPPEKIIVAIQLLERNSP